MTLNPPLYYIQGVNMIQAQDRVLDGFHGDFKVGEKRDEFNGHFWLGYGSLGRGSRPGCGCGVCKAGWEAAREAYAKVAKRYWTAELDSRQGRLSL